MTTNKTPIQELISLVLQDRSMVDKHDLLGWMYKQGIEKEKAFAFDCFEAGCAYQDGEVQYSMSKLNHDKPSFDKFYSQYAAKHTN